MRTVLFHCKTYRSRVGKLADRPYTIAPEPVTEREQTCLDCLVVFITVEKKDVPEIVSVQLAGEIKKMAHDIGRNSIVVFPFAHLSSSLASSSEGLKTLLMVEECLKKDGFDVHRGHFGSHKELLIDVYGHPGNVRFREF